MRAICYTCPGYGLYDIPKAKILKDDDVLIKVAYAGICGSDLNIIKGYEDQTLGYTPGSRNVIGHEGSGIVAELGAKATLKGLKKGDKVVFYPKEYCGKCYYCRNGQENFCTNSVITGGAMADYVAIGEQMVFKLDNNADLLKAVMVEPISVALHGVDLCNIRQGCTAAISGGGGMGLLFAELVKLAGATKITVLDPVEEKRKKAISCGAGYVLDPKSQDIVSEAMRITDGKGFDIVIEASGASAALQTAYEITGRGGTLELFACYPAGAQYPLDLSSVTAKEIKIVTVFQSPYMFPRAVALYEQMDLTPFLKDVFKPEEWKEAFAYRLSGVPQKVIFNFI